VNPRLRAALIAAALATITFQLVTFYVNGWPGPPAPLFVVSATVVLAAYLGTGIIAWQRHPADKIGLLFTLTGYAWFLPQLLSLHYAVPFTIANGAAFLYQGCLGHLGLAWPYGKLRGRADRIVVAVNYAWNIASPIAANLFWNPRATGCSAACPANLLLIDDSPRLYQDIGQITTLLSFPVTAAVIALIVVHWRRSRGYARRAMNALIWVSIPVAGYITVLNLADVVDLSRFNVLLYQVGPLLLAAPPVAYLAAAMTARRARGAVSSALVSMEPGPHPAKLRDALARALGDPALQLAARTAGAAAFTDTDGATVDLASLPAGRMVTPLDTPGEAVLVHDAELRHEPELIRVAAAAASLALEHARLQAEIQVQLDQVRASRARIVEAGDAERRRLERDLHDGAQQRLVTLSLAIGIARDRAAGADPDLEALLESASKEARAAIAELRELARGIHPAVLTQTGLEGAIQALVERSPVTTQVRDVPAGRFPAQVEATAYFVVSEALANVAKHAQASAAVVTVREQAGRLEVEVSDDGVGGAQAGSGSGLAGLADRVASVGGSLTVHSPPGGGTRLQAVIPCP
jgi:signal transduction histidine kinase